MLGSFLVHISSWAYPQPQFLNKTEEFNEDFAININDTNVNHNVEISNTTLISQSRPRNSYFRCLVNIINVTAEDCFAFGTGLTLGSGGAFYFSVSNADVQSCQFIRNKAIAGGALSIVAGDLYPFKQ